MPLTHPPRTQHPPPGCLPSSIDTASQGHNCFDMSADKAHVASGANAVEADALRRRNVPASQPVVAPPVQLDDKKKALKKEPSVLEILDEWESVIVPIIFTALALFTRLYKIGLSDIVTWDEAQSVLPLHGAEPTC